MGASRFDALEREIPSTRATRRFNTRATRTHRRTRARTPRVDVGIHRDETWAPERAAADAPPWCDVRASVRALTMETHAS